MESGPPVKPELREAVELAARITTNQTFGPFRDEPDSPFYRAPDLDPDETWERLAEKVAIVSAQGILEGMVDQRLRRSGIAQWHAQIFGEFFPEHGGRFRTGRDRGQFGVMLGTREHPEPQTYVSTNAQNLPRGLDEMCAGFEALAREDREFDFEELVQATVRAYVKFLNLHPFIDGNGRASFVLLQFALARLDLPAISLEDHDEHQWCLGQALRRDGKQTDDELLEYFMSKFDRASRMYEAIRAE